MIAVRSACDHARAMRGMRERGGMRSRLGRRAGPAQGRGLRALPVRAARSIFAPTRIMPWIKQIPIVEATGPLKRELDAALRRAGRLWHIVHVMSLNPPVLKASIEQYLAIMYGPSPLSRGQRELLATVVSAELDCFY